MLSRSTFPSFYSSSFDFNSYSNVKEMLESGAFPMSLVKELWSSDRSEADSFLNLKYLWSLIVTTTWLAIIF